MGWKTWIVSWALGQLIALLTRYEDEIVAFINKKVDLPRMDEANEAKLIRSILEAIRLFVRGER